MKRAHPTRKRRVRIQQEFSRHVRRLAFPIRLNDDVIAQHRLSYVLQQSKRFYQSDCYPENAPLIPCSVDNVLWSDAVEAGGHDRSFFSYRLLATGQGMDCKATSSSRILFDTISSHGKPSHVNGPELVELNVTCVVPIKGLGALSNFENSSSGRW